MITIKYDSSQIKPSKFIDGTSDIACVFSNTQRVHCTYYDNSIQIENFLQSDVIAGTQMSILLTH
jgi:hypothetical protein